MKGFRFETFNVHAGNQAAFDLCRAIASEAYDGVRPVVLLGSEGCGKSHLLWSIVSDIRARAVKTGLALIMPQEFPEKVRALIQDPQPIQRGTPAILLVDGLESFREDAADLEAVVRVFLESRQQVVLASAVLPDRLSTLSTTFKLLLNEGQMVELHPAPDVLPEIVADRTDLRADLDAARKEAEASRADLDAARTEAEASRAELETVRAELATAKAGLESARIELETSRAETSTLQTILDQAQADAGLREEIDTLRKQEDEAWRFRISTLQEELTSISNERDVLLERSQEVEKLTKERNFLRAELEDARGEAEAAFAEQARLQGLLSARRSLEEELRQACAERDEAIAAAGSIEELRTLFTGEFSGVAERFQSFLDRFQAYRGGPGNAMWEELECERDAAQALVETLRVEVEEARAEIETAQAGEQAALQERTRYAVEIQAADARLKETAFELEKARRQIALQTAEMDALREEAVSQVAKANIQAGEMELRIGRLESALETARAAGRAAEADGIRLSETLAQATETLRMLVKRQAALKGLDFALPPPVPPQEGQATLFEARPFEALPAQFETLFRDAPPGNAPETP